MNEYVDIAIIGGGAAGLAAALGAYDAGVRDILIIEREAALGGILKQCIHNGFGLHRFNEELTGPEYASRDIQRVRELGIRTYLDTTVLDIDGRRHITMVSAERGLEEIDAGAVVLAMGSRERTRGAMMIPGSRPAGVYTAGSAQALVNLKGQLVGREIVMLGSGDIGLIMARRLTYEGAHVKCVLNRSSFSGGLKRNIVQCLDDYGIPLRLSRTITAIHGKQRISGVTVSHVDPATKLPIPGTEEYLACDTLLLSAGLIPENELSRASGVHIDPATGGASVDEHLQTSIPGVFSAGNVLHIHDLVDFVSEEGLAAGAHAARFVARSGERTRAADVDVCTVSSGHGVRGVVPQSIHLGGGEQVTLRFRPDAVYEKAAIVVTRDGGEEMARAKRRIMVPAEMQEIGISTDDIGAASELTVTIEGTGKTQAAAEPDTGARGTSMTTPDRELICIRCPLGCMVSVFLDASGNVARVEGNTCARGEKYAIEEVTCPMRTVTALVDVAASPMPVSVKTAAPIPKALIGECLRQLKSIELTVPVHIGDVVVQDICGTGVEVVATKDIDAAH